jgi:hypothetical protein
MVHRPSAPCLRARLDRYKSDLPRRVVRFREATLQSMDAWNLSMNAEVCVAVNRRITLREVPAFENAVDLRYVSECRQLIKATQRVTLPTWELSGEWRCV